MAAIAGFFGETLLSAVFQKLFETLASSDLIKFARRAKLHSELNKCQKLLLKIQALLHDAEEKQLSDTLVKIWLNELKDLAFDLEDILDDFATEALKERLMIQDSHKKVGKLFVPYCFGGLMLNFNSGSKVKKIYARLQEIVTQKDNLNLRQMVVPATERVNLMRQKLRSTSLVDESCVYGRENDKNGILEVLFGNENQVGDGVCVIPIIGMGGIGKTTVVQLVYNDDLVSECFDFKVWAYVSEEFNVLGLTKMILQAITSESCDESDLNLLQVKLKEKLSGKKFLLVLDDVWNENYELWDIFRRPFIAGDPRSKIIVTSRNEGVASIMGTVAAYHLKVLSNDDCFLLFTRHALGTRNVNDHPDLKLIGEKIVRKCKGLPLAAKVIGGLLRTKLDYSKWEIVLNSKVWDFPEEKSGIIPALLLSYHHLPSHLKQLFVYCSIFPKGYKYDKDELILLWMAEGFLPHQRGNKLPEDVGCYYFNELLARSFFEKSSSKESRYVMHDLINDLAKYIAQNMYFNLDDELDSNELDTILPKTRHVTFTRQTYEVSQRFKDCFKMKSLRTLIALPIHASSCTAHCYLSNAVLQEILPRLRYLRSLCLSGYCVEDLPDSIGDLKHLRYLNVSRCKIKLLPESVSNLVNLQTLRLRGCTELTKLPTGIKNLINLCSLDIRDTNCLKEMPPGICNLMNLRILPKFIVGKNNPLRLRELKNLSHLRGELSIYGLHNVVDIIDARIANLNGKDGLLELAMEWSDNFDDSRNEQDEMCTLNFLQPNRSIEKLGISHYGGTEFPSWIGDPSFTNIVSIHLCNCIKTMSLPSLGRLPLLKELYIEGMNGIKKVDFQFYVEDSVKPFPSLETLMFKNMLEWEYWCFSAGVDEQIEEIFPHLHDLTLQNCPKLIGNLPSQIPSLVNLTVSKCPKLIYSFISLPTLLQLNIEKCNNVLLRSLADLPSLTSLKIKSTSELICLQEGFVWSHEASKPAMVSNSSNLTFLSMLDDEPPDIVSIEHLITTGCLQPVSSCGNSGKLPYPLQILMSLKILQIESCPKFESFPETGFAPMLRHLLLRDCPDLKCLPGEMMVEDLEIEECPSLKYFPKGKLPTTIKRLKIHYCTNLEYLPGLIIENGDSSTCMLQLEKLEIVGCPSLTYSSGVQLLHGLKTLKISDCVKMEPFLEMMIDNNTSLEYIDIWNCKTLTCLPECLHGLSHLTEININSCPCLKFFPETGLPIPYLRMLYICDCVNLRSLPTEMQNLTSLQDLTICDCPELESLPVGGLPPNLTSFEIWDCKKLKNPISEWKLHKLTSLRDLSISGVCSHDIISFPDNEYLLPGTLISLWIGELENLEILTKGLGNLTCLEELEIANCPKLQSFPWAGLPVSLGKLSITGCPLLRQQLSKGKGSCWSIIAHIPCVEVDGKCI